MMPSAALTIKKHEVQLRVYRSFKTYQYYIEPAFSVNMLLAVRHFFYAFVSSFFFRLKIKIIVDAANIKISPAPAIT